MAHSLFISRSINRDISEWKQIESVGWTIVDQTLIEIKPLSFHLPANISWVFFSSKNAVHHFFTQLDLDQLNQVKTLKFASIGKATGQALANYVVQIDYIGDGLFKDKDSFLRIVDKNQTILFPMAKNSRRYVQRQIGSDRKTIDLIVYDNYIKKIAINKTDLVILTSPMNAQSFIQQYNDDLSQIDVWSVGPATSRHLLQAKIDLVQTFSKPQEQVWASEIWSHIQVKYNKKK